MREERVRAAASEGEVCERSERESEHAREIEREREENLSSASCPGTEREREGERDAYTHLCSASCPGTHTNTHKQIHTQIHTDTPVQRKLPKTIHHIYTCASLCVCARRGRERERERERQR